jgi:hypothetical protein
MTIWLRRREFIAGLGGAAAWPLAVSAEQQPRPTIGWLTDALAPRDATEAFRRGGGLEEPGFLEGREVTVEYHKPERGRSMPEFPGTGTQGRGLILFLPLPQWYH